jgi:hypothetical protein
LQRYMASLGETREILRCRFRKLLVVFCLLLGGEKGIAEFVLLSPGA